MLSIAQAPKQWGSWYWVYCPHNNCPWVQRTEDWLDADVLLNVHLMEAHRD